MSYVTAIVLAAGRSLRFRSKVTKPLIEINSKPVIIHSLHILSEHPYIRDIIIAVSLKNSRNIISKIDKYRIKKIKDIVLGGRRRQDSVINALKAMDSRTDLVLVHDAVRPFINKETVSLLIKEAKKYGAAIVGVPVKATIKEVTKSSFASLRTLRRRTLSGSEVQSHKVTSYIPKLEQDLLRQINKLNIGPMGLGGETTALAVNIETYPTHIAGLPVAVNISCHALRSATKTL